MDQIKDERLRALQILKGTSEEDLEAARINCYLKIVYIAKIIKK